MRRIWVLVAPRDFIMPIMFILSRIIMNMLDIRVKPETNDIRIRMTITLVSSKSSQLKYSAPVLYTVSTRCNEFNLFV